MTILAGLGRVGEEVRFDTPVVVAVATGLFERLWKHRLRFAGSSSQSTGGLRPQVRIQDRRPFTATLRKSAWSRRKSRRSLGRPAAAHDFTRDISLQGSSRSPADPGEPNVLHRP